MKEDNNAQITLEDHICVHLLFFSSCLSLIIQSLWQLRSDDHHRHSSFSRGECKSVLCTALFNIT